MMNPIQMFQEFQKFQKTFQDQNPGMNPQDYIQKLLNEGKVTQQQFEQARNMASAVGIKL